MLKEKFSVDFLKKHLIPYNRWHPYPKASEKRSWNKLSNSIKQVFIDNGTKALNEQWPHLPATLFLDFVRTGNRSNFEKIFFKRRCILSSLMFAECMTGNNRFINSIADAAWSICEESTWCLPAHIGIQKAGSDLPDITEPIPDLFAAETGALMAWLVYLLENQLNTVSPRITERIKHEIKQRILIPCLTRNDFWWMGFNSKHINNWNPWINSNWLACALLIEDDSARRIQNVLKILQSLDMFIANYPSDGGCDEGPSYWGRAAASLFDCLELLFSATNGKLNLYDEPIIKEMGRYIYRVHIADNWFVNFADAPAELIPPAGLIYQYGIRIKDKLMKQFALSFLHSNKVLFRQTISSPTRILRDIFLFNKISVKNVKPPLLVSVWLPALQVLVVRSKQGSSKGFTLAAKGGHNAESHNHNDVGNFIVFSDGNPMLIDAGVETYTRKTFSSERYTIWTMQSQYHNLPTIDGIMQSYGENFKARDIFYSCNAKEIHFSLNIANAYPPEANLNNWIRTFIFKRNLYIEISDSYSAKHVPTDLFWSFITPCKTYAKRNCIIFTRTKLQANKFSASGCLYFDSNRLKVSVEKINITDQRLLSIWGKCLYRIILRATNPPQTASFNFRITSS